MAMIEIGVLALRSPDGSFLPAQPIYREVPDELLTVYPDVKEGEPLQEPFICEFQDKVGKIFEEQIKEIRRAKALARIKKLAKRKT